MRPIAAARATEVSSTCFHNMTPASQAIVFASSPAALPTDILNDTNATTLQNWGYKDRQGLRVFLVSNRKNRGEYLKYLGSNVVFDHPARLVNSVEDLKEIKDLQDNMNSPFTPT